MLVMMSYTPHCLMATMNVSDSELQADGGAGGGGGNSSQNTSQQSETFFTTTENLINYYTALRNVTEKCSRVWPASFPQSVILGEDSARYFVNELNKIVDEEKIENARKVTSFQSIISTKDLDQQRLILVENLTQTEFDLSQVIKLIAFHEHLSMMMNIAYDRASDESSNFMGCSKKVEKSKPHILAWYQKKRIALDEFDRLPQDVEQMPTLSKFKELKQDLENRKNQFLNSAQTREQDVEDLDFKLFGGTGLNFRRNHYSFLRNRSHEIKTDLDKYKTELEKKVQQLTRVIAGLDQGGGVGNGITEGSGTSGTNGSGIRTAGALAKLPGTNSNRRLNTLGSSNSRKYNPIDLSRLGDQAFLLKMDTLRDDYFKSIASADFSKADQLLADLKQNAVRQQALQNKKIQDLNKKLIAEGKKPLDMDSVGATAGAGGAGSNVNSSSAQGPSKVGSAGVGEEKVEAEKLNITSVEAEQVGVASTEAQEQKETSSYDSLLNEMSQNAAGEETSDQQMNDFISKLEESEGTDEEVRSEREGSIFKQVSNRYFFHYPKLIHRAQISNK